MPLNLRIEIPHMKKVGVLFFACLLLIHGNSQPAAKTTPIQRPKVVVGIVVEQMRWEFLYRYYDGCGSGGFKRLLNDGFSFASVMINYIRSFTAVGDSTI